MQRFKNLLVYAGTDQPESAIARAISLAMENDATLTLMDVIKPQPQYLSAMAGVAEPNDLERILVEDHRRRLLDRAAEYADTAIDIEILVKVGDTATEIIREVIRHEYDLVIKTADGETGLRGTLFGSVAKTLLRQCPCAVLILKPAIHGEFDQVLAAIDVQHSDEEHRCLNHDILSLAQTVAVEDDANLHVVAAWDLWMEKNLRRRAGDVEVDKMLEATRKSTQQKMGELLSDKGIDPKDVQIHVQRGAPAAAIRFLVEKTQADLLVMGTVCRTGVAGFLIGNTAESVLADVTCSVLALKPDGFVCPVQIQNEETKIVSEVV